jgi:cysteine desulfurase
MGVLTHGNVRVTLPLAAVSPGRADDVARFCTALPEVIADVRAQLGVERL